MAVTLKTVLFYRQSRLAIVIVLLRRMRRGYEKIAIFDQYLALPRNDTRYDHSYYEMRIGNRTQALERYHFQRF